jgi:hypothetical protein
MPSPLHDPNLPPELKIVILIYILAFVLPEIIDKMPQGKRLQASWLLKQLHSNCEQDKPK